MEASVDGFATHVYDVLAGVVAHLGGASPGWLTLGVALHLGNQLARGRGWWAIVRATAGPATPVRRRDAIAAWVAGAGAAGVVTARAGDALRVLMLSRRTA